ncbi:hypothetical protein [Staphylococcus phage vB_StaM_SA1]|nr:hypothetical protein [Staphylococcus phage vB_StaM_SA1]
MRYYEFNTSGMLKILELQADRMMYEKDIFKQEKLYLKENEFIKTKNLLVDNGSMDLNFSIYQGSKEDSTIEFYLSFEYRMGTFLVNFVDIDLNKFKEYTISEVYKYAENLVLNKTFKFNRDNENDEFKENIHYKVITEKEYKEHKVVTNFS